MKNIDILPKDFVAFCYFCEKIITKKDIKKKLAIRVKNNQYRHVKCNY